jgi:polyferredoxin
MTTNFFTVRYGIITNAEGVCPQGVAMSRSLSKAMAKASSQAWNQYECSRATNWADCWVRVYKAGRLIAQGFEGELQAV